MTQPRGRRAPNLPDLTTLHERHPGLTPAVCAYYAEAATVCLSRHHSSPATFSIRMGRRSRNAVVSWHPATEREKGAWANRDDATRDGAYAIAIAAVEGEHLVTVNRAETRTGADYYLAADPNGGEPSLELLENALRLEVSGSDSGTESELTERLNRKVLQTRNGESDLPALACVVGFWRKLVLIKKAAAGG